MIPTLQYCDTQHDNMRFKLSSEPYHQLLSHIITKGSKRYYEQPSSMLTSEIIDDIIIIKCNNHRDNNNKPIKISLKCSTEYTNIMRVLSDISRSNKTLLRRALYTSPSRLLLIIHAIITIPHCFTLLEGIRLLRGLNNFPFTQKADAF